MNNETTQSRENSSKEVKTADGQVPIDIPAGDDRGDRINVDRAIEGSFAQTQHKQENSDYR